MKANTYRPSGPTPWGVVFTPRLPEHLRRHLLKRCAVMREPMGPLLWRAVRDAFNFLPHYAKVEHTYHGTPPRLAIGLKVKQADVDQIRRQALDMGEDPQELILRAIVARYGDGSKPKNRAGTTLPLFT